MFCLENVKGRHHSEEVHVNGMTILKWILEEKVIWLRVGIVAGSCERYNEPSGSIKDG
jgi:hypothetical protein